LLPRLYAILDIDVIAARGLEPRGLLRAWLDAGVRLVQLRAKRLSLGPFLELADWMAADCRAAGAVFIVNDRVDVARLAGADGVHLGQDDISPEQARAMLPAEAWMGLSTHNESQLRRGAESGPTYLAIGPVFQTSSKDRPDPVIGLEGVSHLASNLRASHAGLPLVAIGGITLATAAGVLAAGADSVAVISDLLGHDDPAGRAGAFVRAVG
jgi:thiamine-phosphate pyrophosphorylase